MSTSEAGQAQPITPKKVKPEQTPWEVRSSEAKDYMYFSVQRGTGIETQTAAEHITDYGLACVIEAACNMRDGTTE